MTHKIETRVLTIAKGENRPIWEGLGTIIRTEGLYADEVLKLSGMDWWVTQEPITVAGEVVPGWLATVRSSDGSVLGIQTEDYKPVQPADMTNLLDVLVEQGVAMYRSAGSIKKGRVIFFLVQPPERTWIAGEEHLRFILGVTSFDGSVATRFKTTMVRVECNNTLQASLFGAGREIYFRHVGDISARMDEARKVLGLAEQSWQKMTDRAEALAMEKFTATQFDRFLTKCFPAKPESERSKYIAQGKRDKVRAIYTGAANLDGIRGTKLGVLNAVVEWDQHNRNFRNTQLSTGADNRFANGMLRVGYAHRAAALLGVR